MLKSKMFFTEFRRNLALAHFNFQWCAFHLLRKIFSTKAYRKVAETHFMCSNFRQINMGVYFISCNLK